MTARPSVSRSSLLAGAASRLRPARRSRDRRRARARAARRGRRRAARRGATPTSRTSWLTYGRTYAEQRYSPLAQIDERNVGAARPRLVRSTPDTHARPRGDAARRRTACSTRPARWSVVLRGRRAQRAAALDATTRRCRASYGRQRLLRRREPRRRALPGPRLRRHARRPAVALDATTGRAGLVGRHRRPEQALHDHGGAARREGQGDHRQRRRRVRRARLRLGLRRRDRRARLALLHRARRSRAAASRRPRSSAPRRPGPASGGRSAAAARSGTRSPTTPSSTCSTSAPATARPGAATSAARAAATTSTSRSILALRPDTGELVWHYQTTPGDNWDFTATQHIMLADLEIGGAHAQGADAGAEERLLLRARPRDRRAALGRAVRRRSPGRRASTSRRAARSRPTALDYRERTGRGEAVAVRRRTTGSRCRSTRRRGSSTSRRRRSRTSSGSTRTGSTAPGAWNTGADPTVADAFPRELVSGHLLAWDPVAQKEVWRAQYTLPWNGGTLATGGQSRVPGHRARHLRRLPRDRRHSSCSRRRPAPASWRRPSPTSSTASSTWR